MKVFPSARAWAWSGAAALILTVGAMAHRRAAAAKAGAPEELRDAVASPALTPGARSFPGAFARPPLGAKKTPILAARLSRFADALDAKAASLRRSVQPR